MISLNSKSRARHVQRKPRPSLTVAALTFAAVTLWGSVLIEHLPPVTYGEAAIIRPTVCESTLFDDCTLNLRNVEVRAG